MLRNLFRKYMLICLSTFLFIVWILFCDNNSYIKRCALNSRISDLEELCDEYSRKISADSASISEIKKSNLNLEKYARERYYMKKDNEDIFIIVE